jgi:CPA2 family monovalent cation:H+ antiporter-2
LPLPKILVNGLFPLPEIELPKFSNHLVLIGKDSRVLNLSSMANFMKLPYISIVFDPTTVRKRQQNGEMVIYGDANNEPVLQKAHVDTAEVVVISIGDLITSMSIVEKVRHLNAHAHIIVRTRMVEDIEELYRLGASEVIPEEFETAIEMYKRVLRKYLVPYLKIREAVATVRNGHYGMFREQSRQSSEAKSMTNEFPNIEIIARTIGEESDLIGKTLLEVMFRKNYGVTLVAIKRGN